MGVIDHGLYLFGVNALHHVLEVSDGCPGQWCLCLVPVGDRVIEQLAGLLCESGQYGCEVDGELSEEVQRNTADILEFFLSVGVLVEDPGRGIFDEPVGTVGQCHHFSHGQVEVTRFVGFRDAVSGIGGIGEQSTVLGIVVRGVLSGEELGGSAGEVDQFADQVRVHLGGEFFEVEVEVIESRAEFGGVVVSEPCRVEMFQVGRGLDEGAFGLGHFPSIDGQESVDVHLVGQVEPGGLEHRGPEQGVEVGDVLSDEVVDFGFVVAPPGVEVFAVGLAPLSG